MKKFLLFLICSLCALGTRAQFFTTDTCTWSIAEEATAPADLADKGLLRDKIGGNGKVFARSRNYRGW